MVLSARPDRNAGTPWTTARWSVVADTLADAATGLRVSLSHPFVVPGSDTLYVNGAAADRSGYVLNYTLGTIRVDLVLEEGDFVVVRYRRRPLLLQPVYRLRSVEIARSGREVPPVRDPASTADRDVAGLRNLSFGGTKSVSFQVGSNRGTQLDQTLQATIEGDITPSIRVRALLSDNNLPIQPEGNTQELEYFDQVFVEIEGSRARASLGDFSFENRVSAFSPITRRLKGFSASVWRQRGGTLNVAGATAKGEYRRSQFRGRTGLQGPYELLSAARVTPEVILAGSEVVTVDGALVRRGRNADYVIDYEAGTITFTPGRLITDDTEIAADFEVTQERYQRSTLFTSGEDIPLGGGTTLSVLFAREGDDTDRPLGSSLGEDERRALEDAGDDAGLSLTGGVTAVASGQGQYARVPADPLSGIPEHFEFDDSTGTFNVSFVEVEPGKGPYRFAGISGRGNRYYEFVADSSGAYTVGRRVPLPERVTLAAARVRRATGGKMQFDAEFAASNYDRNLLSSRDDGDNDGVAWRARLGWKQLPAFVGKLRVGGELSRLESRFHSLDPVRPQYFYRDWNLENTVLEGAETIGSFDARIERNDHSAVDYELARIERDDFSGTRNEARLSAGNVTDRGVSSRIFNTRVSGSAGRRTRSHATSRGSFAAWRLVPSVVVSGERYLQRAVSAPDSGLAYRLYQVALADRSWRRARFRVELERRDTDVVDSTSSGWRDARIDRTLSATVGTRASRSLRGELTLTRREEDDARLGKSTSDLARVKATINVAGIGLRSDVDYEINQAAVRTLTRSLVDVGEGRGDYNERGDFVGKGKGRFMVVFAPTSDVQPARRVSLNLRLVWKPADGRGEAPGGLRGWIYRNVSVDQTLGIDEQTRFDPAWKVYLLVPSALQRDAETLFGVIRLRQEWSFLDGVPGVSLTARVRREDTEDNRFEGIRENQLLEETSVRFSRSLSGGVSTNVELGRTLNRRSGGGLVTVSGSTYDISDWRAVLGISLKFSAGGTLDADASLTRRRDVLSLSGQNVAGFRPRVVWRFSDRASVFATWEFNRTWDTAASPVRPALFARPGASHRWNVAPNLRLARSISIVGTYSGRREKSFTGAKITEHQFRLETRALF